MNFNLENVYETDDSDFVDEELEARLYSAIFYEPVSEAKSASPIISNFSHHENMVDVFCNNDVTEVNEKVSSVQISTIQDDSSDSENFFISSTPSQNKLKVIETNDEDSDSIFSLYSNDKNGSSDVGNRDLVLGVCRNSINSMCTLNDSKAISKILEFSRDDPDLWKIYDVDKRSKSRMRKRYFDDNGQILHSCKNCGQSGHLSLECRNHTIACILCGEEGHEKDDCTNQYCYACLAPGHTKDTCRLAKNLRKSTCDRCGQNGHNSSLCTELWRQYRDTTEVGKPLKRRSRFQIRGCCNCGRRGHSVDNCRCRPLRSQFFGPLPRRRVLVYDRKDIYEDFRRSHLGKKLKKSNKRILKRKKKSKKQNFGKQNEDADDRESVEARVNHKLMTKVLEQEYVNLVNNALTSKCSPKLNKHEDYSSSCHLLNRALSTNSLSKKKNRNKKQIGKRFDFASNVNKVRLNKRKARSMESGTCDDDPIVNKRKKRRLQNSNSQSLFDGNFKTTKNDVRVNGIRSETRKLNNKKNNNRMFQNKNDNNKISRKKNRKKTDLMNIFSKCDSNRPARMTNKNHSLLCSSTPNRKLLLDNNGTGESITSSIIHPSNQSLNSDSNWLTILNETYRVDSWNQNSMTN